MQLTNENNHSLSIAVWLATDDYDHNPCPGEKYISATGLLNPTRMIVLADRVSKDMRADTELDITDLLASRLGTAIHDGIEKAWNTNAHNALKILGYPEKMINRVLINPTSEELEATKNPIPVYMEQRAFKRINGHIIGGKYDFVGDGHLEDFKSTGVYSYIKGSSDEKHRIQGSIYRWLNPEIVTSDIMLVQYLFTDWSKLHAKIRKDSGYPQSRAVTKKLQLLSLEETEQFIFNKLSEIETFRNKDENDLPGCTSEDLWQSDPVYKYFGKVGAKRSSGNFDNYAEAHAKMTKAGKGFIEEVPGSVRRCGYCKAYDLCTQKDIYLTNGTLVLP